MKDPFSTEVDQASAEKPPKKVLKESEMALSVDGEYLGEVGNSSYPEKRDMFEYDPNGGLLVNGRRGIALLENDDLIGIAHDLGHISVDRLFESKAGQFSDREFASKLSNIYVDIKNKIDKITFLGEIVGVRMDIEAIDYCIKKTFSKTPHFSPEELLETVLEELKFLFERKHSQNKKDEREKLWKKIERIETTGVLDVDPKRNAMGIVHYFYLYCRIKGIDESNSDSLYEAFDGFQFLKELMEEYERKPQGKPGVLFESPLVVACERLELEWDEEENK